ncbi:MAG: hypothetical protein DME45_12020 [Verrucomicrobia bacterium]|nr:MAG: hypothetical protein DME45_12020 [Verrucomicrobiota bacterium]
MVRKRDPIWGAHAPRVLSLAPRQRLFWAKQERHFGEAPKWTREGAWAPQKKETAAPQGTRNTH